MKNRKKHKTTHTDRELAALKAELARETEKRKQVENEMLTAKQKTEAANLEKNHFLANISHEIRTPVSGIVGAVEMLFAPRS